MAQSLAAHSPTGASPVGQLTDSSSRKTLIYLILTLNHIYPDYDFSDLRAEHFTKEGQLAAVKTDIDTLLMESGKVWAAQYGASEPFLEVLWKTLDAAIEVYECDVYSYKAMSEGDPFTDEGNLWAFNYFFYNKKLKRILYFTMHAVSKTTDDGMEDSYDAADGSEEHHVGYNSYDGGESYNDDSMMFDDMEDL